MLNIDNISAKEPSRRATKLYLMLKSVGTSIPQAKIQRPSIGAGINQAALVVGDHASLSGDISGIQCTDLKKKVLDYSKSALTRLHFLTPAVMTPDGLLKKLNQAAVLNLSLGFAGGLATLGALRIQQMSKQIENRPPSPKIGDWNNFSKILDQTTATKVHPNCSVTPLVDGPEAFGAMLSSIDEAKHSVDWTTHIFDPDETGWEVARHLSDASQRGCKVRLLLDNTASGSALRTEKGRELLNFLRESGVEVEAVKTQAHHCNHRKVLVVDGQKAFTGGMNVGNFDAESHDFIAKLEGSAVQELQDGFNGQWQEAGGSPSTVKTEGPKTEPEFNTQVRVLHHEGQEDTHIKDAYLAAIATAETSITLMNPYISDSDIFDALKEASQRGVNVTMLLPHNNDYKVVERSMRSRYQELSQAGIHVFEYAGKTHTHGKVAVFDHKVCTIGTSNLDRLSLEYNDEVNLWVDNAATSEKLESVLMADTEKSISMKDYRPTIATGVINTVSDWMLAGL